MYILIKHSNSPGPLIRRCRWWLNGARTVFVLLKMISKMYCIWRREEKNKKYFGISILYPSDEFELVEFPMLIKYWWVIPSVHLIIRHSKLHQKKKIPKRKYKCREFGFSRKWSANIHTNENEFRNTTQKWLYILYIDIMDIFEST